MDYIGEYPEHYPQKHKALRQSLATHFLYAIFHLAEANRNKLLILEYLIPERNPKIIHKRITK